jgi:hypothetical protein
VFEGEKKAREQERKRASEQGEQRKKKLELLETSNFIEIGTPQGPSPNSIFQIETFSQYSLNLSE